MGVCVRGGRSWGVWGLGVGGWAMGGLQFLPCHSMSFSENTPHSTAVHSVSVGVGLWDRKQQSAVTCSALVTVEGRKCLPQHHRVHFQEVKKKNKHLSLPLYLSSVVRAYVTNTTRFISELTERKLSVEQITLPHSYFIPSES